MKQKLYQPSPFVRLMAKFLTAIFTFVVLAVLLGIPLVLLTAKFPDFGTIRTQTYPVPNFPPQETVHIVRQAVDRTMSEYSTHELLEGNFKFFGTVEISNLTSDMRDGRSGVVFNLYRADPSLRQTRLVLGPPPENPSWGNYIFLNESAHAPRYQDGLLYADFRLDLSLPAFFLTITLFLATGAIVGFVVFYFCRRSLNEHGIPD